MMLKSVLGLTTVFAALASALPASGSLNITASLNGTASTGSGSSSGSGSGSGSGGGVTIYNNLGNDLYLWSVANQFDVPMVTLKANGGTYSENWRTNPNGGGISIKIATQPVQKDILQFEYTEAGDTIYWDLSCIDMGVNSEFTKHGFSVHPSDPQCPSADCAPGDAACADAYLVPTDDHATHGCPIGTHMDLHIGST